MKNNKKLSPVGTCFQGNINLTYKELVSELGEPILFKGKKNDGDKIDAEWYLLTPFGVGTIYNYKDGKNYLGDEGTETVKITEWHIGGANKETYAYIIGWLNLK
jgi:hypothetical protein